mgnify:CR=1 FL=1|tara:strand:- start:2508 stop:2987 length:480 start_codon:yes stop_codon:yes gene_type:complete
MKTAKKQIYDLTCPHCAFATTSGAALLDHILESDHTIATTLSEALAKNHNLYNLMVADFEKSQDGQVRPELFATKGGRRLIEALTEQSLKDIHDRCDEIATVLHEAKIDASRVSMCALYMVGRLSLAESGCPDAMYKMLDEMVDEAIEHSKKEPKSGGE